MKRELHLGAATSISKSNQPHKNECLPPYQYSNPSISAHEARFLIAEVKRPLKIFNKCTNKKWVYISVCLFEDFLAKKVVAKLYFRLFPLIFDQ